jgi:hypothetical protein
MTNEDNNPFLPDREVLLAERAAAMASCFTPYGQLRGHLGGEGLCKHYNEIARLAIRSFDRFPVSFDWDTHVSSGGDCWDVEMYAIARNAKTNERH